MSFVRVPICILVTLQAAIEGCSRIVCPSGGSAGMATAYSARKLGLKATIIIPDTTPAAVGDQLRNEVKHAYDLLFKCWNLKVKLFIRSVFMPFNLLLLVMLSAHMYKACPQ